MDGNTGKEEIRWVELKKMLSFLAYEIVAWMMTMSASVAFGRWRKLHNGETQATICAMLSCKMPASGVRRID